MGKNNNQSALLRQWELLKLMPSHGDGISAAEMTQALNNEGYEIDKRQVERDLNQLSEAFPFDKNDDTTPQRWKWLKGAAIDLPGLTLTEALSIQMVEDTLKPLLPVSMMGGLQSRFDQAKKELAAIGKGNRKAKWGNKVRFVSPTLPLIPPAINPAILETVQDALLTDVQIDVEYVNRERVGKTCRLHPLGMVNRGAITYLIASTAEYDEPRLYALHRFKNATRTIATVKHPEGFDLDEYIASGGMQFGTGKTIRLAAWIHPDLANILAETPLSEDQKLRTEGERIKLTATVADTWQLGWWIMSFGDCIEVTAPVALRRNIAARLASAAAQYEE